MGEAQRKRSATNKLIAAFPTCCLCASRPTETREHFPPTNLFDRFHRPDSIVVPACRTCNRNSALADLIAGIIARIGFSEAAEHQMKDIKILLRQLKKFRPEFVDQMFNTTRNVRKRALAQWRNIGLNVPQEYEAVKIPSEMFPYLHLFCHKAILCHYFAKAGKALPSTGGVLAFYRPKETIALGALPKHLLEMLGSSRSIFQGRWNLQDQYQYKESYGEDGTYAVACRFRLGFFTFGFAVDDLSKLDSDTCDGFVKISQLSGILTQPRYRWYDQFRDINLEAQV